MKNSPLINIETENLKTRLSQISREYVELTNSIIPLLQKAANFEKEIEILSEELKTRNDNP